MLRQLALIASGYGLALALGLAAVVVNEALTPTNVADASSGMAAFGDLVAFAGVAGLAGLVPSWLLLRLIACRLSRSA